MPRKLASPFLAAVSRWLQRESLGDDAAEEFAEMRNLAVRRECARNESANVVVYEDSIRHCAWMFGSRAGADQPIYS